MSSAAESVEEVPARAESADRDRDRGAGPTWVPSAVTLGSVVSSSTAAMALVSAPASPARDALVAFLLGTAMLCDRFDGYIARKLNATSDFGAQLDSIADVLAFGLLPALWVVGRFPGNAGVGAAAVAYVLCAAVRLARFHHIGLVDGRFGPGFVGMPTPGAAAFVLSVIGVDTFASAHAAVGAHAVVEAGVLAVAAAWMVSPFHYPKRASSPGVLPFLFLVPLAFVALVVVAVRAG